MRENLYLRDILTGNKMVLPTYKSLEEKNEHPHYKEPEHVNTIDEFKEKFEQLEAYKPPYSPFFESEHDNLCNTAPVFRGQNEAKYKLYTSAQREWITKEWEKQLGEDGFVGFVQQLILQLKKTNAYNGLYRYFESMGATENDLLLLSFLQHYSTPSPLLDFTYNKYVALFFAIDGLEFNRQGGYDIGNYFSIYTLPVRSMYSIDLANKDNLERLKQDGTIEYRKKTFSPKELKDYYAKYLLSWTIPDGANFKGLRNYPFLFIPNPQRAEKVEDIIDIDLHWSNPNIIVQEGCFVMNRDKEKPLEGIFRKYLDCLDIHKSLAPYIREEYLKSKGVTKESLFPDFNAIAQGAYEAFKRNPTAKISLTDLPDSKD